jgi:hypothetical protein
MDPLMLFQYYQSIYGPGMRTTASRVGSPTDRKDRTA